MSAKIKIRIKRIVIVIFAFLFIIVAFTVYANVKVEQIVKDRIFTSIDSLPGRKVAL